MKGIILAGGNATRLFPVTKVICKQLLPVYDKPMIYYSLSALMLAGIREILLISTPASLPHFEGLLGNGANIGINISYAAQEEPKGIAESFIIGEEFIGSDKVALILGDNIFYGDRLSGVLQEIRKQKDGATILGYYVRDPYRYGVIGLGEDSRVTSLTEKPKKPKSNYAVTGLYFYDNKVVNLAKDLKPSKRRELEITDINAKYLKAGKLKVKLLGRGYAWFDMGTHDSLIEASMFIKTIEERQGLKIGCIEEIAYRMGYISAGQLEKLAESTHASYGAYLKNILKGENIIKEE